MSDALVRIFCDRGHSQPDMIGEVIEGDHGTFQLVFRGRRPTDETYSSYKLYNTTIPLPKGNSGLGLHCYNQVHGSEGLRHDLRIAEVRGKAAMAHRNGRPFKRVLH